MSKFKFGDKVLNSDGVLGVVTNVNDGICFVAWSCHELDEGWHQESELTPATDWVKCSERMPPKSGAYLCILKSKYNDFTHVAIVDFYDDDFDVGIASNVIGWMPLPAPPTEVER